MEGLPLQDLGTLQDAELERTPLLSFDSVALLGPRVKRRLRCGLISIFVAATISVFGCMFLFVIFPALHPYTPHVDPSRHRPPQAPGLLTISNVNHSTIDLNWAQAKSDGNGVLGYELQRRYGGDSSSYSLVYNGSTLSYRAHALRGGSDYCFRVRAYNTVGLGNFSDEACGRTLDPIQPGPVEQLRLTNTAYDSLTLAWDQGATGGSFIDVIQVVGQVYNPYHPHIAVDSRITTAVIDTKILVPAAAAATPSSSAPTSADTAVTTVTLPNCTVVQHAGMAVLLRRNCTIQGLEQAKNYSIVARAHNRVGYGPWSFPALVLHTDTVPNPFVPMAPLPPYLRRATADSLIVGWDRSAYGTDGGAEVLEYSLAFSPKGKEDTAFGSDASATIVTLSSMTPLCNVGYTDQSYTCAASLLTAASSYCFVVRARNRVGWGPWSTPAAACYDPLAGQPPNAPMLPMRPQAATSSSLRIAWQRPSDGGANISSFELEHDDYWTASGMANAYNGADNFFDTVHAGPLLPATVYRFRVRARNRFGTSAWSPVVSYATIEAGACGNSADVAVFKATKKTMKGGIQACIIGCAVSGPDCVVKCVHERVGLSTPCATCWAEEGSCTLNRCLQPCLNPGSQACAACSEKECFPDCVKCSGVSRAFFPP